MTRTIANPRPVSGRLRACGARAKRFDGLCSELAVELRALVIDPDLDVVRSRDRSYQHSAFAMTQGVVDEVEDGAVQRFAVAGDGGCSVSEDVYRSGQPDISFQRIDPSRPARVRHSRKPHLRRRQTTRTGRPSAVDDLPSDGWVAVEPGEGSGEVAPDFAPYRRGDAGASAPAQMAGTRPPHRARPRAA
jgi:hypothetical protein